MAAGKFSGGGPPMKSGMVFATIVLLGGAVGANERGGGQPPASSEGVIDPKADAALRRMSDYLAGLKSFQVDTTTVDEKFTANGHKIQQVQGSRVTVAR